MPRTTQHVTRRPARAGSVVLGLRECDVLPVGRARLLHVVALLDIRAVGHQGEHAPPRVWADNNGQMRVGFGCGWLRCTGR